MMQKIKWMFSEKKSQLEQWFDNLNISSDDVIRYAWCFGVGFLAGLLFKRWSKYIILVAISVVIVLAMLHGFALITVNFNTIQELTGLQNITNIQALCKAGKETAQLYAWELGYSGIGFIIGFKTG